MAFVNYRETLVTYLRSDSHEEAVKALGITTAGLSYRLASMKKAGVRVPKKATAPENLTSQLFVAQLNSLVNKYEKETK